MLAVLVSAALTAVPYCNITGTWYVAMGDNSTLIDIKQTGASLWSITPQKGYKFKSGSLAAHSYNGFRGKTDTQVVYDGVVDGSCSYLDFSVTEVWCKVGSNKECKPQPVKYWEGGSLRIIEVAHSDIFWLGANNDMKIDTAQMAGMLDLMKSNPDFKAQHECILFMRAFLEYYPDRVNELNQRLKERRMDIGASFSEPFEETLHNELLVRQMYGGRKWLLTHYPMLNETAVVAFHQDGALRALQMPQIYKKAGVKYLKASRYGQHFFRWASPDGSDLVSFEETHYGQEYRDGSGWASNVTSDVVIRRMNTWANDYTENKMRNDYALTIGSDYYAPREYPDLFAQWGVNPATPSQSGKAGMSLHYSHFEEFLSRVDPSNLETIVGERPNLWWAETSPTHHLMYNNLRDIARKLPMAEAYSVFVSALKKTWDGYPSQTLQAAWLNATIMDHGMGHETTPDFEGRLDWLANSKSPRFADYLYQEKWEVTARTANKVLNKAQEDLTSYVSGEGDRIVVHNYLSWQRSGYVELKETSVVVVAEDGSLLPTQVTTDGTLLFLAEDIPSMGYRTFHVRPGNHTKPSTPKQWTTAYDTQYFRLTPGNAGLAGVYDKELQANLFDTSVYSVGEWLALTYTSNGASETRTYGFDDRIPHRTSAFEMLSRPNTDGPPPEGVHYNWEKKSGTNLACSTDCLQPLPNDPDTRGCVIQGGQCLWENASVATTNCDGWSVCGGFVCDESGCYARRSSVPQASGHPSQTAWVKSWNRSAVNQNASWLIVEDGPVRAVFRTASVPTLHSTVSLEVVAYKETKRLDFALRLNNWISTFGVANRMSFPLADSRHSKNVSFAVPFGVVRVGIDEAETPHDQWLSKPGPDVPQPQRGWLMRPREIADWFHAEGDDFSMTMSSSVGMFDWTDGAGLCHANQTVLQPELLMHTNSNQGPFLDESGDHSFTFSMFTGPKGQPAQWKKAVEAVNPLSYVRTAAQQPSGPLPSTSSLVNCTGDNVWITLIKKEDNGNGTIVRLFDNEGRDSDVTVSFFKNLTSTAATDIIENDPRTMPHHGNSFTQTVGHWSIETYRVSF